MPRRRAKELRLQKEIRSGAQNIAFGGVRRFPDSKASPALLNLFPDFRVDSPSPSSGKYAPGVWQIVRKVCLRILEEVVILGDGNAVLVQQLPVANAELHHLLRRRRHGVPRRGDARFFGFDGDFLDRKHHEVRFFSGQNFEPLGGLRLLRDPFESRLRKLGGAPAVADVDILGPML
jgi:hypothetical protein